MLCSEIDQAVTNIMHNRNVRLCLLLTVPKKKPNTCLCVFDVQLFHNAGFLQRDLSFEVHDSCIMMASLQRDLCLKVVQHLPYVLRLEIQQLVMLCFNGVSLLSSFATLPSNSWLQTLMRCL